MEEKSQNSSSKRLLAWILIVVGFVWILRKAGIYFDLPHFYFHDIFFPFKTMFHGLTHIIFSWPMILIIVGLILMAGKRSAGLVLVVVGGVFLIPKIFFIPGFTFSLFFPVLLVGLGIAMVARLI